jgi:tripartite-type tricarboxylate transporter receptor subunit TctC
MKRRQAGLAMATVLLSPLAARAQPAWPSKPLKMIVPNPPGGSSDVLGRVVAQKLSVQLGQPVVVENRGGASGNIGTEALAKSAPDGYTIGVGTDATHASNVHLIANPPFNPLTDFTPLALAALNPIVLVVHPSVPATNLKELLAYVQANPAKAGYGSSGNGSPHHLAGELLRVRTGAGFTHVPYRGGGPALVDLLGGQIGLLFASAIVVAPHIKEGRARAIAVTRAERYEGLPSVPTFAETIPGFEMPSWLAFYAPASLPAALSKRLSEELLKVLTDPEVTAKLIAGGLQVAAQGPQELSALQRKDYELKGRLIRDAGIKGD